MEMELEDSVDMLENCREVECKWKILNNSSWEWVHGPVLFLSRDKSVKEDPKNDLLSQAVG